MSRSMIMRLFENFFRRRWLFLAPVVVMVAAGAGYFFIAKTYYTAQAVIYIPDSTYLAQLTTLQSGTGNNSAWTTPSAQVSAEITDLLKTDLFIRAVILPTPLEAKMSGNPSAVDKLISNLRTNISAAANGNNQVIITAKDENPDVAIKLTSSVIDSYLSWKSNLERSNSDTAVTFFTNVIQQYQDGVTKAQKSLQDYLNAHPVPIRGDRPEIEQVQIAMLQKDLDLASQRLNDAIDKAESAKMSASEVDTNLKNTYITLDSPHIPQGGVTSRTSKAIMSLLFVVVGVMLSGAAAVLSAMTDHSFYLPEDVRQRLDLPVLAIFPQSAAGAQKTKQSQTQPVRVHKKKGLFNKARDQKPLSAGEMD